VSRLCEFDFSDGAECAETAVANIAEHWYCAEHYDVWMAYYRRSFATNGEKFDERMFREAWEK
jgi:hypothetical protein